MLVFRNEIPVAENISIGIFFDVMRDWVKRSPHTSFVSSDFDLLKNNEKIISKDKKESFEQKSFLSKIAGVKYIKKEINQEWTTTVVINREKLLVAIEIYCESSSLGDLLPKVHVPYVMKKIIRWGGMDGNLRVSCDPHNLHQCDVENAQKILNGFYTIKKPIVYLSATYSNTHVVNPKNLARKLFGLAHVVVEPNKAFGERLGLEIRERRPAFGRVGIFFPNSEHYEFMQRFDDEHDEFINKIQRRIVNITKMASIAPELKWYFLERSIGEEALQIYKRKHEEEYSEFAKTFDEQNQKLEEENRRLESENQYLRTENQRLCVESREQKSLLFPGSENEFYQGEKLALILEILQKEKTQCAKESLRKRHLIDSILDANILPTKKEEVKNKLKTILSKWQNKSTEKDALKELGFSIADEGKHIKLTWADDSRYTITVSKSPSDNRGLRNCASDALKLLF